MCSSMKQPKPERLVVTDGMPMTVHSAVKELGSSWLYLHYSTWVKIDSIKVAANPTGGVAPRFVIRWENTQMAAADEFFIVHR